MLSNTKAELNKSAAYKKKHVLFKKIANFTGELLQNYEKLEYEIFRIFLKHVSNHFSVLFQFVWLCL